jgi:cysteinyl-tRNA synthetase
MKLYNTLSSDLAKVEPDANNTVTMYSCGPTVYNHVHIGNLRTFIMDDLLRRALDAAGYQLKSIMNITDVDDKTIAKSQVEHPDLEPMEALKLTTHHYEKLFFDDLAAVGVDTSLFKVVRATESIPEMQQMIAEIFAHNFAYISDSSVYFDLKKYQAAGHKYGRLANVNFSAQARIDNDEYDKSEAQDFVLWKAAKPGEPSWPFELDGQNLPGRPGWHIECSAMAIAGLGQSIQIHTGGIDLKFPHHENEIAQTVAATGHDFCQIFTHHNHLLVDGRKMSKSLHNFHTLADITAKGFHPLAFRLLCLQAGHGNELNFTWESLEAAQNTLLNLTSLADISSQFKGSSLSLVEDIDNSSELINNDLNSAEMMAYAFENDPGLILYTEQILGLGLANRPNITPAQKQLIADREAARAAKDWPKSDDLRAQLAKEGIEIDDTPAGPRWRRASL